MVLLRVLRTLVVGIVVGGVAVGACFAALIPGGEEIVTGHHYTVKSVTKLRDLSQKSFVYWADGTLMGELGLENRQNVRIDDILATSGGRRLVNAVIATEDQTFWTNNGIDPSAVFRAFVANVTSGEIQQGGSTITQQLVKNRLLSPARDVNRKIREILDALRLNDKFSKKKILEEYLNTVYFGQNSYGVNSAAARFFSGKRIEDLTVGEAALLAGLIANPEGTNPFTYPERAWKRRADVLQLQVEQGYLTQGDANVAKDEPLPTERPPAELRPGNFLVEEVQRRLLNDPRLGSTAKERHDKVLRGGLRVFTTFDPRWQGMAERATREALPSSPSGPDWVASLVAIDPVTGAVKAMVGGRDFNESEYNIATHEPGRQPGSTWKVITLAAALQAGYSPNDLVNGAARCSVPSKFGNASTVNAEGGGGGVTTLWNATAQSINCAYVRLSTSVGQERVIQMAHDMGITQQRLFPHLTLSIGDIEATPLEMATVMATIANDGVHQNPYFVQRIVGPDGLIVIDESNRAALGNRVLNQDVARCVQLMLRRVVTGGTGTRANVVGHDVIGKTGTTDGRGDAWFIGATRNQVAVATWFGNRTTNRLPAGFGGQVAAPIVGRFLGQLLSGMPSAPLPNPETNPVCNRRGRTVNPDGGHAQSPPEPPATTARRQPVVQTIPAAPAPTLTTPTPTVSPGQGPGLPGIVPPGKGENKP